jgi:deazaflavin-dependent oxidoreductase (nitroreductase family)
MIKSTANKATTPAEADAVGPDRDALPPTVAAARRGLIRRLHGVKRWMYRSGRPGWLARVMNRLSAAQFSAGVLSPSRAMTVEVVGRRSGKVVSFPVVVAEFNRERYLVSMLGEDTNWVRNVRAAGGRVVLRRRGRDEVRLVEVPIGERAPILRRYLQVAPGARPHILVDQHAPLEEFAKIAPDYPVFRIDSAARDGKPAPRPGATGPETASRTS